MLHQILNFGGYGVIIVGILLIIIAACTFRRKEEAEISQSLIEVPIFRAGVAITILGIILKLIFH